MCGIAGIVSEETEGIKKILEDMTQKLRHRGPDSFGYYIKGKVGLGSARLRIIDIERGDQPIKNENGKIWVIHNGEIYNFEEIREKLQNHKFYTNTDTEILVHLYEEKGLDFINYIEGMFAFALYDEEKDILILARDRKGKKPLYWYFDGKNFLFASEMRSLLPYIRKNIDDIGLQSYFFFSFIPSPLTIFKDVKKLQPAHIIIFNIKEKRLNIYRYWKPKTTEDVPEIEEIIQILEKSVKKRLKSDVPLGVFLSGGIDSSLVSYFASRFQKITTINVSFEEDYLDESKYAKIVSSQIASEHIEVRAENEEIEKILSLVDEPLGDPSFIPTYILSKTAKKFFTVALSGDGGDELFLGYPTFHAEFLAKFLKIPKVISQSISKIFEKFETKGYYPLTFRIKQFFKGLNYQQIVRNQIWINGFSPEDIKKLTGRFDVLDFFEDEINLKEKFFEDFNELASLRWIYFRFYLADGVLQKVDRASMLCSLEVRCPLLDDELINYILSKNPIHFFNIFETKPILRKILERYLPKEISKRKKHGFLMNIENFVKERKINSKIVNPVFFENLDLKNFDNIRKLWLGYTFEVWEKNYL